MVRADALSFETRQRRVAVHDCDLLLLRSKQATVFLVDFDIAYRV